MIDFSQYAPQRMFLLQGDETAADVLIAELVGRDPLVQALSVPRFTMEHARNVAAFATEGSGESRTFVVYFSVFSSEAAQVLLKSLEEPAADTTIIFMTRYPYLVPQTVRSRLLIVHEHALRGEPRKQKEIIGQIQKEAAEKDDDAATRRGRALVLLDALEAAVIKHRAHADMVYRAKAMLLKANLPTKFVLDYVATVVR
jgi:DNA polymerase III delta prime subunit